jgi:hypothetical protein
MGEKNTKNGMGGSFFFYARRMMLCVFFVLLCVCARAPLSAAQDITVQAEVNTRTVALDSYIRLTITVTGVQTVDPVDLPDIEGFQSRFIGPSSRVSIVNGQYSSSYAFLYDLYPEKTGTFTIPSLTLSIRGNDYQTKAVTVEVVPASGRPPVNQDKEDSGQTAESLKDRLFLIMASPHHEVFLNQKVPLVIRLYIAGLSVRDVEYPEVEHAGFFMDAFEEPRQFEEVLNGIRFMVVEFRTHIYPSRSGELVIGPAKGKCNILMKSAARSRQAGSFGLFDDDFFSGFFDSYTSRPAVMESEKLTFTVYPLPDEDKPEWFSGAVGKFSFNMNVSPKTVKVGDPVTVRMTVEGTGSLRTFELPRFQSNADFRAYDPVVKEENGIKMLEQVLIPQRVSAKVVPEVSFSFFDVDEKAYRTISWGPVDLEVEPVEQGKEFRVVGLGEGGIVRQDDIGRDISFIKTDVGRLQSFGYAAYRSFGFIIWLAVISVAWLGGVLFYHFTYRLKTDERFAKRLQAPLYARKGLKSMKMSLDKNNAEEFYNELFKTLERYFSHKFHWSPGAVTVSAIQQELDRHEGNQEIVSKVKVVFDECEASRYASAGFSHDHMMQTYETAREIIDWFERKF